MKPLEVIGINIFDRIKESGMVQNILTRYGHVIKTRFGFHEVSEEVCSRVGFILLELRGDPQEWDKLKKELNEIGGIVIKSMKFAY